MSSYTRTPKSAEPVVHMLEEVVRNRNSTINETEKDTRVLTKRLDTLKKRSPKWAILLTLLAAGSIGYAMYLSGLWGITLSPKLLKFSQVAATTIKTSKTTAARTLRTKSRSLIEGLRKAGVSLTGAEATRASWWNPFSVKKASFKSIGKAGVRQLIVPIALAEGTRSLRRYNTRENVKHALNQYHHQNRHNSKNYITIPPPRRNNNNNNNNNGNNYRP